MVRGGSNEEVRLSSSSPFRRLENSDRFDRAVKGGGRAVPCRWDLVGVVVGRFLVVKDRRTLVGGVFEILTLRTARRQVTLCMVGFLFGKLERVVSVNDK